MLQKSTDKHSYCLFIPARLALAAGLVAAGAILLLGLALVLDGALPAQAADDPGLPPAGHDIGQIQLGVSTTAPRREPPGSGPRDEEPGQGDAEADGPPPAEDAARQAMLNLPLRFIANAGQTDPAVRFTVKGAGHTLFFTPQEVVFAASSHELTAEDAENAEKSNNSSANSAISAVKSVVRLRFEGAKAQPAIEGLGRLPGVANFFIGNDPARWQVNVPTYEAVVYRDLYPGIDLVYRGTEGRLKSEFHLAAGADPVAIVMVYSGLEGARLRADGALVLQTPLGELVEEPPLIYQKVNGLRRTIQGGYRILFPSPDSNLFRRQERPALRRSTERSEGAVEGGARGEVYRIAFRLSAHDPAHPLVIDPELDFSTYLGGGDDDYGDSIAVDGAGNAYVTGWTRSSDFPTANAIQTDQGWADAFVTQIIRAGGTYTLAYSTYLGGGDDDWGAGIAVDGAGDAYVTGDTHSSDFPTVNAIDTSLGGSGDAFVTQIIGAGGVYTLACSTYLGGGHDDRGRGIAVDGAGAAYITGYTSSSDFPTAQAIDTSLGGGLDAFVTQIISASGAYTLAYSTYLGGGDEDYGVGIAVDGAGDAYVTGFTYSSDFPIAKAIDTSLGGSHDAFVTRIISASGVYTYGYSTYLGGSDHDWGRGIAVDGAGAAYVTGRTYSSDFPTANAIDTSLGGNQDAFVTQIISAGGVYTYGYSTYLGGGSNWDFGYGIAVDGASNAYVTGWTSSSDFPTANAIQTDQGGQDAFVTQIISASGVYTYGYSTYLGGGSDDQGYGIAVDGAGNAYVTGWTRSGDFPTAKAIDTSLGGWDAFVARIANLSIAKSVSPASAVAYQGVVTYTVVLANSDPFSDAHVLFTDSLPAAVDFGGWIENPGAVVANDAITWTGTLTNSTAITFTFTATHTGSFGDVVTNTAHFSSTAQTGSDDAVFTVSGGGDTFLPIIYKNYRR